jgi:hypothetical protein
MIERKGCILNFEIARIITIIAMTKTIIRPTPDISTSKSKIS